MKYILTLLLFATLFSCKKEKITVDETPKADTIVVKRQLQTNYDFQDKDIEYKLIIKGDTASAKVTALQDINGTIRLNILLGDGKIEKNNTLYKNKIIESTRLLKEVPKDFKMDSITYVWIGWLIHTGDCAATISNEYFKKYGNPGNMYWYNMNYEKRQRIYDLIDNSVLSKDIDILLAPYGKKTGKPELEKIIFEPKETLIRYNELETKDSDIPARILDCMIGFKVIDK